MDTNKAFEEFRKLQADLHALRHAANSIYYDGATAAPSGATQGRGETMGVLSEMSYKLSSSKEASQVIDYLLSHKDELDASQCRELELFNKSREKLQCIPVKEYVEFTMLLNESEAVWHEAKKENDYAKFAPYLKKVFEMTKRIALYYRPNANPYDILLDDNEMGLTTEIADKFFEKVRAGIVPLLKKVIAAQPVDDSFLFGSFALSKQKKLSELIMRTEGISAEHCVLGETEHPFTLEFNNKDVRITTHYYNDNFASSMYSVLHEGGHALYELGSADELEKTSLAGGVSMGIHECQSRFFENYIGRSRPFCTFLLPKLHKMFPKQLSGVSVEDFYRAVNKAQPSLIRTEADELTYALHIMIRYELEKALIAGTIGFDELPELWNAKYKEYLGIDVPDNTSGVLQDVHWSGGMIGYFPSYALGSAYGAQLLHTMKSELDFDSLVSAGNLAPIRGWLTDRIFKFGRRYDPLELVKSASGEPFDPKYFTDYLTAKYTEIYGL